MIPDNPYHDYHKAYNDAVTYSRRMKMDVGLSGGKSIFSGKQEYILSLLPKESHRCGYELRCEVVTPESPQCGKVKS